MKAREARPAATWPFVLELVLLVALFALLVVAGFRFFQMLNRIGVDWTRGLPIGALFGAAAFFAGRRVVRGIRAMIREMREKGSKSNGS